eukprot:1138880-Pelagomonas_calceolata.AAC.4
MMCTVFVGRATCNHHEPGARIVVVFRATGGAPILQQSKVKLAAPGYVSQPLGVSADSKFSKLVIFLKKQLKTDTVVSDCWALRHDSYLNGPE